MKHLIWLLPVCLSACLNINGPDKEEYFQKSLLKLDLTTGEVSVIKKDIAQFGLRFFYLESGRIFFCGDSAGYYATGSSLPVYFNFSSNDFLLSRTHKYILFSKKYSPEAGLFLLNTSTLNITATGISLSPVLEEKVSFSRNEDKIVFRSWDENQKIAGLKIMDLNSLSVSKVVEFNSDPNSNVHADYPVFSSDSHLIYFIRYSMQGSSLCHINSNGDSLMAVSSDSPGIYFGNGLKEIRAAWSAGKIFYKDYGDNIYKLNEEGNNLAVTGLSHSGCDYFNVSTDGSIIFWANRNVGPKNIFYLHTENRGDFTGSGYNVYLSVDGSYLFFTGVEIKYG